MSKETTGITEEMNGIAFPFFCFLSISLYLFLSFLFYWCSYSILLMYWIIAICWWMK